MNPATFLGEIIREIAKREGLEVDEESIRRTEEYCDELIQAPNKADEE